MPRKIRRRTREPIASADAPTEAAAPTVTVTAPALVVAPDGTTADVPETPPAPMTPMEAKEAAAVDRAVDSLPPSMWNRRWLVIKLSLMFCGAMLTALTSYAMIFRVLDAPLLIHFFLAIVALVGAIIGSYVFGAAWDDKSTKTAVATITSTLVRK